ncbi:MAG TPA: M20/M25/M40 family metallo-hydrolase [Planctomycetaceae bacterium]|nr:M20/M25/M40 family metallo-hydrolase [Planctomycetaceae bacterium]
MTDLVRRLSAAVNRDRLLETAVELIRIPSPTRSAGRVADRLAGILAADGFVVERIAAGWPEAPAVVVRFDSGRPGPTLQFNGHLDTVHLPFVPPRVENGVLYGSGAADMKGGVAAMVEALRVLRDTGALAAGRLLLTAHDLHEAPWGDGRQVDGLIDAGCVGDAVLLPEYLCDRLAVVGRGMAVLEVRVTRAGEPVHEVLGGIEQPSVIVAGAEVIRRFAELDRRFAASSHPDGVELRPTSQTAGRSSTPSSRASAGLRESLFIGQVASGEIYNQSPTTFRLYGTRRWLPGNSAGAVEQELRGIAAEVSRETGTQVEVIVRRTRDAFEFSGEHAVVEAFQQSCRDVMGHALPLGTKPFVDDGNTFAARAHIPAITHGPAARGAHTVNEEVAVDELVRVARVYALTAARFSGG